MNRKYKYIAHARKNEQGEWQVHDLGKHLYDTAAKAKEFAHSFKNSDWAEVSALWHDLGKFLSAWQSYIRRQTGYEEEAHIEGYTGRPNHSTVGAMLAIERFQQYPKDVQKIARILAYIIAGHHAGLPDWNPDSAGGDLINRLYQNIESVLDIRELNQIKVIEEAKIYITAVLPKSAPLGIKSQENMEHNREHFHLWIRILFSCLVDADFLDTEAFMSPGNTSKRELFPSIHELSNKFTRYMEAKQINSVETPINLLRRDILKQCRDKAELSPGFFSLTVPTGGGKTLSSMAFALSHALKYSKQRIIMAIPYTSIIEQTVSVYRDAFGEDAVLEHHSNIDPDKEDHKSRLASENWDAPIVVTTNVQLFESLFASRTSACRKLHNIVNSVIILDEAQMLPPEYLKPVLSVLRGLVEHFSVTVILCTATQPAFLGSIGSGQAVFEGLSGVREIINNPGKLVIPFKRVEFVPPDLTIHTAWADIAEQFKQYEQVLCVVNTRQDCRDLHALMPQGTIHLSANMCGEERSEVISVIKNKLKAGEIIRVISTQLVEAGVDIDFPIVYRALAGIDSIAQAAGRCNREGRLNAQGCLGKVVIFQPPKSAPRGLLRKGEDTAKEIFHTGARELTPALYTEYFRKFYASVNDFDKPRFYNRLVQDVDDFKFQFRTFAQNVRLIDDIVQQGIIVWYRGKERNSFDLIDDLRRKGPEYWITRKLQRFIVNVPLTLFYKLRDGDYIEEVHGYWVQKSTGLYKPGLGLLSDSTKWDVELFIT